MGRVWRDRAFAASAVAVVLACTGMVPAKAGYEDRSAQGTAAAEIDLGSPEDGITDPLADVVPLQRDCAVGQTDVNSATANEIAAAFSLSTYPTVQQIIARRPWLTALDLTSVPGVPLSKESMVLLRTRGCARPLELPEPAPLACTRSTQIDLQSASAARIAKGLSLPRTTADAIIAHRPVPQNLDQIVAPRTPGLDPARVASLLSAGRVCVTPMAFDFAGTGWRWVAPDRGAVIEAPRDAQYALIVPPNAVEDEGTWGRVTPDSSSLLPSADVHLFGAFTGEVAVRLPDVPSGDAVVIHDTSSGVPAFSWGDSTQSEIGGSVVAPLRSLSDVIVVQRDPLCGTALEYSFTILCMGISPRDQLLDLMMQAAASKSAARLNLHPPAGPCNTTSNAALISEGGFPTGMTCSATASGSESSWTFANATSSVIVEGLIESFGAVYRSSVSGGPVPRKSSESIYGGNNGNWSGPLARLLAEEGLVVPGHGLIYEKPRGETLTIVQNTGTDPVAHAVVFALFNLANTADAVLEATGVSAPEINIAGCAGAILDAIGNGTGLAAAMNCVASNITTALDALAQAAFNRGDKDVAGALTGASSVAKRLLVGLTVANYGSSVVANLVAGFNPRAVAFRYLSPPPPAGNGNPGSGGAPAGNAALDGSGAFIARTGSGDGFLVPGLSGFGSGFPIRTEAQFLCYASRLLVVDYVEEYTSSGNEYLNLDPAVRISSNDAPHCTFNPEFAWDFSPQPDGNTPLNVILRGQFDGAKNPAWLINGTGEIDSILSGSAYICLAQDYPVVWEVPFSKVQEWQPVGDGLVSTCGSYG